MSQRFTDRDSLVREIHQIAAKHSSRGGPILISIDGLGGTGKSSLARAIANIAESHVFSVDDYLIPHKGTYLPHLRYAELESDLKSAEKRSARFLIVEGLCVLAVLERLDRQPDISVYIRWVDEQGEWADEFYYSEDNDLDEVLQRLSDIDARYPDMPGIGDKDRELVRYHIERRPITHAQYMYDRVRRPPGGDEASI